MKRLFQQVSRWLAGIVKKITPGERSIRGASLGLLIVTALFWILFALGTFINIRDGWVLLFLLLFAAAAVLFGLLARWGLDQLEKLPHFLKLALLISVPLLFIVMSFDWIGVILFVVLSLLCGAAVTVLKNKEFQNLSTPKKVVASWAPYLVSGVSWQSQCCIFNPVLRLAKWPMQLLLPKQLSNP